MLLRYRVLTGRRDIQICIGVSEEVLWKWIRPESNGVDSGFLMCTICVCIHMYIYMCLSAYMHVYVFMYVCRSILCKCIYFLGLSAELVQKQRHPMRDDITFTIITIILVFDIIPHRRTSTSCSNG